MSSYWNLSNQDLIRLGKRTQATKLARIVHSTLKLIRSLFWGKHRAPTPAKDMFTNLRFNSAIVMRSNPLLNASLLALLSRTVSTVTMTV